MKERPDIKHHKKKFQEETLVQRYYIDRLEAEITENILYTESLIEKVKEARKTLEDYPAYSKTEFGLTDYDSVISSTLDYFKGSNRTFYRLGWTKDTTTVLELKDCKSPAMLKCYELALDSYDLLKDFTKATYKLSGKKTDNRKVEAASHVKASKVIDITYWQFKTIAKIHHQVFRNIESFSRKLEYMPQFQYIVSDTRDSSNVIHYAYQWDFKKKTLVRCQDSFTNFNK